MRRKFDQFFAWIDESDTRVFLMILALISLPLVLVYFIERVWPGQFCPMWPFC